MSRNLPPFELLDEAVLEQTAKIIGPSSAARKALDDAKARRAAGQEVVFAKSGPSILVVNKAILDDPKNAASLA